MKIGGLGFVLCGMLLASCAFTPHDVTITATAPESPSSIGNGVTLALEVIDDREDIVVGQRAAGMQGADITAKDIIPTLERELKRGLEAKGFTVVSASDEADAEFEARLRAFKFFLETGFWTGAENASVAVHVEAEKGGRDLDRVYRYDNEERTMVVPAGSRIDEVLNGALSDVLAKIMADAELMSFLAQ